MGILSMNPRSYEEGLLAYLKIFLMLNAYNF